MQVSRFTSSAQHCNSHPGKLFSPKQVSSTLWVWRFICSFPPSPARHQTTMFMASRRHCLRYQTLFCLLRLFWHPHWSLVLRQYRLSGTMWGREGTAWGGGTKSDRERKLPRAAGRQKYLTERVLVSFLGYLPQHYSLPCLSLYSLLVILPFGIS